MRGRLTPSETSGKAGTGGEGTGEVAGRQATSGKTAGPRGHSQRANMRARARARTVTLHALDDVQGRDWTRGHWAVKRAA